MEFLALGSSKSRLLRTAIFLSLLSYFALASVGLAYSQVSVTQLEDLYKNEESLDIKERNILNEFFKIAINPLQENPEKHVVSNIKSVSIIKNDATVDEQESRNFEYYYDIFVKKYTECKNPMTECNASALREFSNNLGLLRVEYENSLNDTYFSSVNSWLSRNAKFLKSQWNSDYNIAFNLDGWPTTNGIRDKKTLVFIEKERNIGETFSGMGIKYDIFMLPYVKNKLERENFLFSQTQPRAGLKIIFEVTANNDEGMLINGKDIFLISFKCPTYLVWRTDISNKIDIGDIIILQKKVAGSGMIAINKVKIGSAKTFGGHVYTPTEDKELLEFSRKDGVQYYCSAP